MKPSVLFIAAAALSLAGQAEACRVYTPPTVTYDRWFDSADQILVGRVSSIRKVEAINSLGDVWARPVVEVERLRALRGTSGPEIVTVWGETLIAMCQPTVSSNIENLEIGDEVVVMLDESGTAFGLIDNSLEVTQTYVARLTPPVE